MEGDCTQGESEALLRRQLTLEREKRVEAENRAEKELQALLQLKSLLLQKEEHENQQEQLLSSSGTVSPFPRSLSTSSSIGLFSRDTSVEFSAVVFGELSEDIQSALGIQETGKQHNIPCSTAIYHVTYSSRQFVSIFYMWTTL